MNHYISTHSAYIGTGRNMHVLWFFLDRIITVKFSYKVRSASCCWVPSHGRWTSGAIQLRKVSYTWMTQRNQRYSERSFVALHRWLLSPFCDQRPSGGSSGSNTLSLVVLPVPYSGQTHVTVPPAKKLWIRVPSVIYLQVMLETFVRRPVENGFVAAISLIAIEYEP